MALETLIEKIFTVNADVDFNKLAIDVARYQYDNCKVYREYCDAIHRLPSDAKEVKDIAFLPIEFFRTRKVISEGLTEEHVFLSSGTTNEQASKHFVADLALYERSFLAGFNLFYGNPEDYCILALLPSYLERNGSSLVYMTDKLIRLSKHAESGFFINDTEQLLNILKVKLANHTKVLLLGVSFALLDLASRYKFDFDTTNLIVMETGGMKGRGKELVRDEMHSILCNAFNVNAIHSEYGMTELLSQAYSPQKGAYNTAPWMKILLRETTDPLSISERSQGAINIIDLANIHSCSFIATQDMGGFNEDGSFEVLGRIDNSQIRGCNLMYF